MRPLTHAPSATQVRNGLVGSRASVKELDKLEIPFIRAVDLDHTIQDEE